MTPRFAVLAHDWPHPHFDLLIEHGAKCLTWRLPTWPLPESPVAIERIADHRKHYLTYEGPLDCDRGTVTRVDCGVVEKIIVNDLTVTVDFAGHMGTGTVELCDESGRSLLFRRR
jgi:hypothetical protein